MNPHHDFPVPVNPIDLFLFQTQPLKKNPENREAQFKIERIRDLNFFLEFQIDALQIFTLIPNLPPTKVYLIIFVILNEISLYTKIHSTLFLYIVYLQQIKVYHFLTASTVQN